ncbi:hypothetical protein [Microbacterium capsulatum]|uniref:Zinc-finger domain-containing protein n=1 Tax=Microbacterium capsulatum TaxID=3041921 RepID=A0ABU0XLT4_9MICO|nr:hypothetical protein [Microbacterium sp. ASV81]MDQ4215070.1 hypothetical protein [Microbacterium sp. ASV81]
MNEDRTWEDDILRQLDLGAEPWMSCDDCFDRSDEVLEQLIEHGGPLPERFRAHLRGCPACREEAQTLVEMIAAERGADEAAARIRLDLAIA